MHAVSRFKSSTLDFLWFTDITTDRGTIEQIEIPSGLQVEIRIASGQDFNDDVMQSPRTVVAVIEEGDETEGEPEELEAKKDQTEAELLNDLPRFQTDIIQVRERRNV